MNIAKEKKKVLILEDEPDAGMLISWILSSYQFDTQLVTTIHDAEEVLQKKEESGFDLLFFDYNLPDGTSIELIKDNQLSEKIPTIIVSAFLSDDKEREFKEYGVIECLRKPINSDAIRDVLLKHNLMSA